MIVRAATPADAPAIQAIYGHHVTHGTGTFEETPPSVGEMAGRIADVTARGLPWLLAEEDGRALGFAYVAPFRLRSGWRHTVEDAVYIAPDAIRQGVGRTLLSALIETCEALDLRQMVALVGDSGNEGSLGLHLAMGFRRVGMFEAVGRKQGRWIDVVFLQRALNGGAETAPSA